MVAQWYDLRLETRENPDPGSNPALGKQRSRDCPSDSAMSPKHVTVTASAPGHGPGHGRRNQRLSAEIYQQNILHGSLPRCSGLAQMDKRRMQLPSFVRAVLICHGCHEMSFSSCLFRQGRLFFLFPSLVVHYCCGDVSLSFKLTVTLANPFCFYCRTRCQS